jgi:2-iminoacetate synthase
MGLLKSGKEGCFCKLNAVLTFKEWLDDFGTPETRAVGEKIIAREVAEVRARAETDFSGATVRKFEDDLARIGQGERDIYF